MSTRKAFHELHPIIGGLNGRSFSERVVWGFVQLTHKREAATAVKIKDLFFGSVVILGGLSLVNSLHAYTFASLKRKKLISTTPLNDALNALILALNASAAAFVLLFTKKFKILS